MAQKDLGSCYNHGHGVEKNEQEALKWYRKAAEQGDSFSQNILGNMYQSGRGVLKDYYEAVKWYRKSAETGNMFALWNLGGMYERGCGVQKDIEEAKECYRKAAEKGHTPSKNALERLENVRVVKPVKYVQPVASQPQHPVLIERPLNLKYCDNCGYALWRHKMIPPRCEKCNAILLKPEETKKNPTGIDQGTADSIRTWGSIMSGIGGVL
jgi:TPR repeat protein